MLLNGRYELPARTQTTGLRGGFRQGSHDGRQRPKTDDGRAQVDHQLADGKHLLVQPPLLHAVTRPRGGSNLRRKLSFQDRDQPMILGKFNREGRCQCPTDGTPSSGMTTPYAFDICRHPTVQPPRFTTESEGVHGTAAQNTVRTNVHLQRQGRMKGQKGRSDPNSRTIPGGIAYGTFGCSRIYCRYTVMLLGGRRVIKANALGIDALKRKETISQY